MKRRTLPLPGGLAMLFSEGLVVPRRPAYLLFVVDQPYEGDLQPRFVPFITTLAGSIGRKPEDIRVRNIHVEPLENVLQDVAAHSERVEAVFWFGVTPPRGSYEGPQHALPSMEDTIMDRSAKIRLWKALKSHART